MRSPLPHKEIVHSDWLLQKHPDKIQIIERVLFFNPSELYERVGAKIDPLKRHAGLQMDELFPAKQMACACGCNDMPHIYKDSEGNEKCRKWANTMCSSFAADVLSIINNYFGRPAKYTNHYYGHKCSECDETNGLELDHIVGVKHGGGGCWLSNYRWLCQKHHRDKTNKDFGFNNIKTIIKK